MIVAILAVDLLRCSWSTRGDLKFLVLSFLIYAPGTLPVLEDPPRAGQAGLFTTGRVGHAFGVFVMLGAIYALIGLITGYITI